MGLYTVFVHSLAQASSMNDVTDKLNYFRPFFTIRLMFTTPHVFSSKYPWPPTTRFFLSNVSYVLMSKLYHSTRVLNRSALKMLKGFNFIYYKTVARGADIFFLQPRKGSVNQNRLRTTALTRNLGNTSVSIISIVPMMHI